MDLKTDQSSILLVVYSAFSEAVVNGIWHKVGAGSLLFIVVVSLVLLAIVIAVNVFVARSAASTKRMKSRLCSAVRRRAWQTVSRWPTFCSRPR
jgi:predicted Na+-dependent transporter